ncbi:hypothetical protein BCR42DRAFT_409660 [Absidia repens]|uniref:Uncharacterized protein n=1 Tax=Absidia repens TaxID=90262 RepID=A0A1X2IMX6_9FUNG|nr:hypothetical protein BCR42DRAFT_409660 [Absidia repens]
MTLGFAEKMPENDDVVYHVEWLENQQVFPSLSSIPHGGGHDAATDEWQFLHRQEILQAQEDFPTDGGPHQLKTCEMEDTWQQVDVLREKQFVDVAAEATDLPQRSNSKVAPIKPQRTHHTTLTEEQRRHFYWEMVDRLDEQDGGGDFYDLYYDRKTHSNYKNNSKHARRHHMELLQRWHHHRLELQRVMDHVQQQQQQHQSASEEDRPTLVKGTAAAAWGKPPVINPRLVHSLVMPRHHHHYVDRSSSGLGQGSKVFKSLMEPDFCLQVKNG